MKQRLTADEHKELENLVYNYPTKFKEGFRSKEIQVLISEFGIDPPDFYKTLGTNTGMIKGGSFLTYHTDILRTFICLLEKREPTVFEWD